MNFLKISLIVVGGIIFLYLILLLFDYFLQTNKNMVFGVSFSPTYTEYLGYDYQTVYKKIVDDWGFKYVRLASQWDEVEKIQGSYDFTRLDWLMDYSAKRDVKVVLAVGRKTPRWPECHLPVWAQAMTYDQYRQDWLDYMSATISRYKNNPALEIWQIENEPFLPFGLCQPMPKKDLTEEIELARGLDSAHKILVTDSGELSFWHKTAKAGDLFGTTMYRVVWNKYLGYVSYDWLPSIFYRAKLALVGRSAGDAYVVELQAEPWVPDQHMDVVDGEEYKKSMSIERFKNNIEYAGRTNMSRSYLWGAEWWYYMMDKKGVNDFVNYAKGLKKY
ncbi:MAG: hypothetical protein COU31_04645 [Candidatus Magasanikbacteria bacterium CG10_big_fil_rev_8_21_14_0_10_40_10]|uniref:Glycoside hydrolase family 5 domain-containing protein n=1 Tax=Candidatus Magasanikbacteria bacterium CG10_big_fil_rev_8_21_14_0_10_40_10 TaxID=1974648 RepID=A0A2M6W2X2_9BACT|nr:MAG: hypothetical protein COU31_04645 [Candidatus Magasanikbacteria bacterium CG10_big_fil_rev_8_21_14_0_10_40_10]